MTDKQTHPKPSFSRPLPFLSFLEGVVALEDGSKGALLMRVEEGSWVFARVLGVSVELFGEREGVEEDMRAIRACGRVKKRRGDVEEERERTEVQGWLESIAVVQTG